MRPILRIVDGDVGPADFFVLRHLSAQSGRNFLAAHPAIPLEALKPHLVRNSDDQRQIAKNIGFRFKKQWDIQHDERESLVFGQQFQRPLANTWMDDLFELLAFEGISEYELGKQPPVEPAVRTQDLGSKLLNHFLKSLTARLDHLPRQSVGINDLRSTGSQ